MEDLILNEEMLEVPLPFELSKGLSEKIHEIAKNAPGAVVVQFKELEFSEETLKTYIPTVMVEAPGEIMDEVAEKYGLKVK